MDSVDVARAHQALSSLAPSVDGLCSLRRVVGAVKGLALLGIVSSMELRYSFGVGSFAKQSVAGFRKSQFSRIQRRYGANCGGHSRKSYP